MNSKPGLQPWYFPTHLSKKAPVKDSGSVSSKSSTKIPEAQQLLPRCDFQTFPGLEGLVSSSLTALRNSSIASSATARQASYSIPEVSERVDFLNRMFPESKPLEDNAQVGVSKWRDTLGGHVRKCVNEAPVSSFVEEVVLLCLLLLKGTEDPLFSFSKDDADRLKNLCCLRASGAHLSTVRTQRRLVERTRATFGRRN